MHRALWLAVALLVFFVWLMPARRDHAHDRAIHEHIATISRRQPAAEIPCVSLAAQRPVVLLVLGQSNAANHGVSTGPRPPMNIYFRGRCFSAHEPLPGGSGDGASLWPQVASMLEGQLRGRALIVTQLAVESTTIADWTEAGPLRDYLRAELQGLARNGLSVDVTLWQQGEADARAQTSAAAYRKGLDQMLRWLEANGVHAPFIAALSTYCPGSDGRKVREAIHQFASSHNNVALGPDTDALQGNMRSGGCHFSAAGLSAAATGWAATLRSYMPHGPLGISGVNPGSPPKTPEIVSVP